MKDNWFQRYLLPGFIFQSTIIAGAYGSGRGWPLYEILYWCLMILVISIVGAAAGDIVRDTFGLPPFVGIIGIMTLIALLVFFGTSAVERFFAIWSFVLYGTYIILLG